ncbi:hypothetical protein [Thiobacter aerophilum]|uniref:Uncharacterized protein n=1 Tax=Thiobacter aerophilum TaxID=3121275 RepID=A0ABV0EE52_9BURK
MAELGTASGSAESAGLLRRAASHAAREARRRRSQRLMLAIALAVSLAMLLVVAVVAGIQIQHLTAENASLANDLFRARQKLERIEPELEKTRQELTSVTRGRLPHLKELTPDKVIPLDAGYVKNIVFTVLRQNGQTRYEYRAVLENAGETMLRPEVRVFVFDQRGIQVGSGEITDRTEMIPGESRAYSASIERFMDEEPRYFYVWARRKK